VNNIERSELLCWRYFYQFSRVSYGFLMVGRSINVWKSW